jgi:hypothetical protein
MKTLLPKIKNKQAVANYNIEQYLQLKAHKFSDIKHKAQGDTQDSSLSAVYKSGICAGLVAYWLYRKRIGEDSMFMHQLEYALRWDAGKFEKSNDLADIALEQLLSVISFLHYNDDIRNIGQHDIERRVNLVLGEYDDQVKTEFSLSFVFNKIELNNLIKLTVQPNKMMRFGNAYHNIGMIYIDDKYFVYDPSTKSGPVAYSQAKDAANAVFKGLAKYCKSRYFIALNISTFDLVGTQIGIYPETIAYCTNLLKNPDYRKHVLQHHNILRVGMRYKDEAMLELLFAAGYKYVRSDKLISTELIESVEEESEQDLNYLLQHGVPIDYRTKHGQTALGWAIARNKTAMLLQLLKKGANPNEPIAAEVSALQWALAKNNCEALILLLASGAIFTDKLSEELKLRYNPNEIEAILSHAKQLNARCFDVSRSINLNRVSETERKVSDLALKRNNLMFSVEQKTIKDDVKYEDIASLLTLRL